MPDTTSSTFRVGTHTAVPLLAGAIAGAVRQGETVILEGIGAGPVNQTMKAIAVARNYLADEGIDLVAQPAFFDIPSADGHRTGLRITVRRTGALSSEG